MKDNSDKFYDKYKPIYNHIENPEYQEGQTEGNEIGSPMYFETYGKDLEYVKKQNPNLIWTIVEGDEGMYITQGFHWVNRWMYLIASKPYEDGTKEYVDSLYRFIED
tara:strand:+ start:237 stop:557 length:321 start_codon:yes stop_codon:yes gene_type:complete